MTATTYFFNHVEHTANIHSFPMAFVVKFALENVFEKSPLCGFLVDIHCYYATSERLREFAEGDGPLAFALNVLCRYTEFAHGDRSKDNIKYSRNHHEHEAAEECRRCERVRGEEKDEE